MEIYILNLLSIPIYGVLVRNRKMQTLIISLQLFLILALRDINVGVDLLNYLGGYSYISSLSFNDLLSRLHLVKATDLVYPYVYESGYVVLNWIAARMGLSFHGFLVLCSAISMISVSVFVYRYSKKPWMSFVLFIGLGMYAYAFGIIRQTLALSILLWTIPHISNKDIKRLAIISFVAFTIHRSALIILPLYYFANKKMSKKTMEKYVGTCFLFAIIAPFLYEKVIYRVLTLFGKTSYLSMSFQLNNKIILLFLVAFVVLLFIDVDSFSTPEARIILWGFLLAIPIEILGMCNDGFSRIVEYYEIFEILLIPNAIMNYGVNKEGTGFIRDNVLVIRFVLAWVIIAAMLFMMILNLQGNPMVPYRMY